MASEIDKCWINCKASPSNWLRKRCNFAEGVPSVAQTTLNWLRKFLNWNLSVIFSPLNLGQYNLGALDAFCVSAKACARAFASIKGAAAVPWTFSCLRGVGFGTLRSSSASFLFVVFKNINSCSWSFTRALLSSAIPLSSQSSTISSLIPLISFRNSLI